MGSVKWEAAKDLHLDLWPHASCYGGFAGTRGGSLLSLLGGSVNHRDTQTGFSGTHWMCLRFPTQETICSFS